MFEYLLLCAPFKANRRAVTSLEYGLIGGIIVWAIAIGFSELAGGQSDQIERNWPQPVIARRRV